MVHFHKKIVTISIVIVLSLFLLALIFAVHSGTFLPSSSPDSEEQYDYLEGQGELTVNINESEGFTTYFEPEIQYLDYKVLTQKSDIILIGTVKEILPSKWNTVDGKRPHDSVDEFEWHDMIYTDVVINVDEYLKNTLHEDEVTVRIFTGTVDNDIMKSDYEATFQSEEKVFLYLIEDEWEYTKDLEPKHYFILGSSQGKLTLENDGTAVGAHGNITQKELVEIVYDL